MKPRPIGHRREQERGFALLLVFAMAASIAIFLYKQLPRAAFEAQRAKEELLIERGEQYIRGIQLYVNKWGRYPAQMEDLEKADGKRYLRRRYKDPMTGEDEWRLVHIDGTGRLTDSKVQKDKEKEKKNENTFITEFATTGSTTGTGAAGVNAGLRRRPSDGPAPDTFGATAATSNSGVQQWGTVPPRNDFGANPANPAAGGANPNPGNPNSRTPGNAGTQSGWNSLNNAQPPNSGGFNNGTPNNNSGMNAAGGMNTGNGMNSNSPGMNMPQMGSNGQSNNSGPGGSLQSQNAAKLIGDILTKPRADMPGGMPGGMGGRQIGGGIAGVATKFESGSIKLYEERQKYEEWEFIYDIKKDKRLAAQMGQMPGAQQPGQPGQPGQFGQQGQAMQGGFGQQQGQNGQGLGSGMNTQQGQASSTPASPPPPPPPVNGGFQGQGFGSPNWQSLANQPQQPGQAQRPVANPFTTAPPPPSPSNPNQGVPNPPTPEAQPAPEGQPAPEPQPAPEVQQGDPNQQQR
jgi:hypothetical protein